MKRTRWMVGVVIVGVVASAVVYFRVTAEAETPRVTTGNVTRGTVVATVEATGTLQPVDTVEVGTQVSGTIKTLSADFNSQVRKGQVVATLDPALLQSQVEQARATVARLRADLDRARVDVKDAAVKLARAVSLSQAQLLPQSELDTAQVTQDAAQAAEKSAQAQLAQAQASLDQSQVNLSHTIITAPVDGIVLGRNVEVGQTVAAGLQAPTLFVIARDLRTMQLNASVDEADIGRVEPGQPVTFRVDAYGAESFTGRVRQVRLQPVVAQNVVSYTTVIDVPNEAQKLKPGMTATVTIEVGRVENALRVPAAALRFRPSAEILAALGGVQGARRATQETPATQQTGATQQTRAAEGTREASEAAVWQLVDGRLTRVAVQTALSDGTTVAISEGRLQEGGQVVTAVATSTTAKSTAPATGSPLVPQMPRRSGSGSGRRG
jgi:HlyD family secretion protein